LKRYIEIELEKRNVRCVALLLDEQAPKTAEAVWRALPQMGDVFHAKYASNEVYILVPQFATEEPGLENRTVVPSSGDVMYFYLQPGTRLPETAKVLGVGGRAVIDLAVFYDRNNLLLSPSEGFTPGNVFATIVRNLDAMTKAGNSVWREGATGESMVFRRLGGDRLKEWAIEDKY
jgi:hypothetical protein